MTFGHFNLVTLLSLLFLLCNFNRFYILLFYNDFMNLVYIYTLMYFLFEIVTRELKFTVLKC